MILEIRGVRGTLISMRRLQSNKIDREPQYKVLLHDYEKNIDAKLDFVLEHEIKIVETWEAK